MKANLFSSRLKLVHFMRHTPRSRSGVQSVEAIQTVHVSQVRFGRNTPDIFSCFEIFIKIKDQRSTHRSSSSSTSTLYSSSMTSSSSHLKSKNSGSVINYERDSFNNIFNNNLYKKHTQRSQ